MSKCSLILVLGLTGSGKTVYADKFFESNLGHVFSIDRWMKALFWQDMPKDPDIQWFTENHQWYRDKILRCETMIFSEVEKLLTLGTTCLLDLGFTEVSHRMRYIKLGLDKKVNVELHFLDVDKYERWTRVQRRNHEKASTFSMIVDEGMFNFMEGIFEPLSEEEKHFLKKNPRNILKN